MQILQSIVSIINSLLSIVLIVLQISKIHNKNPSKNQAPKFIIPRTPIKTPHVKVHVTNTQNENFMMVLWGVFLVLLFGLYALFFRYISIISTTLLTVLLLASMIVRYKKRSDFTIPFIVGEVIALFLFMSTYYVPDPIKTVFNRIPPLNFDGQSEFDNWSAAVGSIVKSIYGTYPFYYIFARLVSLIALSIMTTRFLFHDKKEESLRFIIGCYLGFFVFFIGLHLNLTWPYLSTLFSEISAWLNR